MYICVLLGLLCCICEVLVSFVQQDVMESGGKAVTCVLSVLRDCPMRSLSAQKLRKVELSAGERTKLPTSFPDLQNAAQRRKLASIICEQESIYRRNLG